MVNGSVDDLPDAPPNLAGESTEKGARFHISVSNARGYLCHIHMEVGHVGSEASDIEAASLERALRSSFDEGKVSLRLAHVHVCSPALTARQRCSTRSSPTLVSQGDLLLCATVHSLRLLQPGMLKRLPDL